MGTKLILASILTILIIIAEKGLPVKMNKSDYISYIILNAVLVLIQ